MTTFHGRLLISSLPDLRGIWGLSYDEGSVISTVASASQLILAPILPFFLTALGLRRLLLPLSLGFVCVAFCIPFISGYENLLVAHALMGLLIGSFVTATIQIMLKHLPPPWWVVVLAFFTFRVSLGINSGVSLGAFYLEYMGWQWIYWQSGLIMFVYFVLLQRHLPSDTPIRELLHKPDYSGMAFYCLSAVLIYAGLDQGERLGWFDSGIITVFLAGGIVSFLLFPANEALVERPWAPPRLFADFNIIMSVGMVIIYIFILSANSLLITLFLDTVHDLRPLQSGLPGGSTNRCCWWPCCSCWPRPSAPFWCSRRTRACSAPRASCLWGWPAIRAPSSPRTGWPPTFSPWPSCSPSGIRWSSFP